MRNHAKIVIIGGGAVGVSTLYHLCKAGERDVMLIEKNELTSGSTWHAAGNIPTYANSWGGMRAGNYAWSLYKDIAETVDYPVTYRHTGAFWPAHTQDRMGFFRHLEGISKGLGYDMRMISPQEMEAMHPFYEAGGDILGGIYDPYEGDVDPSQLTQALAKGARDLGADIHRFTCVTGIANTSTGEWKVQTDKGDVTCQIVINAAGYYGRQVGEMMGQSLPVVTMEHQYLVTESLQALEDHPENFPLVRDPDIMFYLRRERNGFLFGSYGHAGRPAWLDGMPDDFANQLFPDSIDDIAHVLEGAVAHIPLLAEAGAQRFVNGPIPYSPDGAPLCGPAAGLDNVYHACCFPVGITHSAVAAKTITEWITEGETEWDMWAWDPRRFDRWASFDYTVKRACELYEHQYAIPFPHRQWNAARPVNQTPLYETLKAKGAVFGQIGGWERAFWFEKDRIKDDGRLSFEDEIWHNAVKIEALSVMEHVGLMDHGGFTRYEVTGSGATDYLEHLFCGRMPKIGRVKLSYMLTSKGKVWSEATIARRGENDYLLCGPTLADLRDYDWMRQYCPDDGSVRIKRGSDHDAALMVMGPKSRALLQELTEDDLSKEAAPWMSVRTITLAGVTMTALRVSYVGELGWELHMRSADLHTVYDAITQAGADYSLVEFGSYALNAMRLEKGYHGWQADFGPEYSVFDAGLERCVAWDKDDFVGKTAITAMRDQVPDYQLVGLVFEDADMDAPSSSPIYCEGQLVGYITSGGTGFRIGQRIALGYVRGGVGAIGAKMVVEILGKPYVAHVSSMPFYDPDNSRLKA